MALVSMLEQTCTQGNRILYSQTMQELSLDLRAILDKIQLYHTQPKEQVRIGIPILTSLNKLLSPFPCGFRKE
jgi:hypothetical protein